MEIVTKNKILVKYRKGTEIEDESEIVIPDGIKEIGSHAFEKMDNIVKVTLPDSLEKIGEYAFCNCSRLKTINIPESVKVIGCAAFAGCEQLSGIILPDSLEELGSDAFSFCFRIHKLKVPSEVKLLTVTEGWIRFDSPVDFFNQDLNIVKDALADMEDVDW